MFWIRFAPSWMVRRWVMGSRGKPKPSWMGADWRSHDVEIGANGLIHFSTCWCERKR